MLLLWEGIWMPNPIPTGLFFHGWINKRHLVENFCSNNFLYLFQMDQLKKKETNTKKELLEKGTKIWRWQTMTRHCKNFSWMFFFWPRILRKNPRSFELLFSYFKKKLFQKSLPQAFFCYHVFSISDLCMYWIILKNENKVCERIEYLATT